MSQLNDYKCPICIEVYIEPVVLPCEHCLCKPCFLEHVNKTSLQCPVCRKRLGTWARLNSRNGTLIDQERWRIVREKFPEQVQARLEGRSPMPHHSEKQIMVHLAQEGEIHAEYQTELDRLRREREEEDRASEVLVQKLLEEEKREMRLREDKLRKQVVRDAKHAFKLADKENKPKRRERRIPPPIMVPRSDSVDSIGPELRHFKPIAKFPRTPPHQTAGGKSCHPEAIKVTPCPKTVKKICFPSPSPNVQPVTDVPSTSTVSSSPQFLPLVQSNSDLTLPTHADLTAENLALLSNGNSARDSYNEGCDSDTVSYHSDNSGRMSPLLVLPTKNGFLTLQSPEEDNSKSAESCPSTSSSADVNGNLNSKPTTKHRKLPASTATVTTNGVKVRSASTPSAKPATTNRKRTTSATVVNGNGLSIAHRQEFQNDEEAAQHFQHLYDLEVKWNIDSSRFAGGANAYSFRKRKKRV